MNTISPKDINIIKKLPPKLTKDDRCAIDTEFFEMDKDRLHRPTGRFACATFCFNGKDVYVVTDPDDLTQALENINESVFIFHNAKFDVFHIRRYAHLPMRKRLWDTMLIEQIMYSGLYNDFSLADMARRRLDIYLPKGVRSEFSTATVMSKEMLEYSCIDTVATWKVYQSQRAEIDDNDLNIWKDIELPFMWTIMAMGGVKLNSQAWIELAKKNKEIADGVQAKYGREYFKGKNNTRCVDGLNLASPKQVKDKLKELGLKKVESTDADALEAIINNSVASAEVKEFAKDMLTYRTYAKRASTYGEKFIEEYVEEDGKIYGDIFQMGAECMPAGELVLTNRGYLPVQDVEVGDQVITHEGRVRPVINTSIHSRRQIYRTTLFNGLSLRTTGNHPFLTAKRGWVQAKNLQVGDVVVYHSRPEQWKVIEGWDNYAISSWGRVANTKTNNILALQPKGKWGHLKITLTRNGARGRGEDRKDFAVHRLVADAFVSGKSKINNEVRHMNGVAWDNTAENLLWGTTQENRQDAIQHGTMSHRFNSSQTKLTEEMVEIIRQPNEYYRGRDKDLALAWGISREIIRDVRLGKRWQEKYFDGKGKRVEFGYTLVTDSHIVSNEVTYGLEVEEDHSHVTGGIVTHNTGRTSSRHPNLQNQPHETEYRDCFVADEGNCMIVADYGSQEPRVAAFLSQDERLIEILNSGKKLYIEIAHDVFHKEITKQDPEYSHVKSTILGIFYGMSAFGLSARLGVSEDEAQEMIDLILQTYPGIQDYIDQQGKADEYVQSIYGRKVWLNKYDKGWLRGALNYPIQGSAADATKLAASRFLEKWEREMGDHDENEEVKWYQNSPLRLLVHDEIVIEVPEELCKTAMRILEEAMVEVANEMHEGIKGVAEVFSGNSWACKH